ncbi:HU family DNA-binding protein [Liquorilactobacillus hordei]|nr:HU family DNA-binding protein [Liquorilactobacillus hordei]QYH50992.1 HU family DNA-binding protein [Liquorilactobacillus hordei DSM 19519]QYH51139.1 HU family DNA-binding protein [Liquorilactobacillus hordei DSM 19519]
MSEKVVSKKELVARIAENKGTTKIAAQEALDAVIVTIKDVLAEHKSVSLKDFLRLNVEFKEAHTRVNNFTGGTINVPAKYVVKAKPSKSLTN